MNIYEYLRSPDIRALCEKTGHEFDSLEMAAIVELGTNTIGEKHAAWREIIANHPDMKPDWSCKPWLNAGESLFQQLETSIECEEHLISEFYSKEQNAFYRAGGLWDDFADGTGIYSTAEKAWEAHRNRDEDGDGVGDDDGGLIVKAHLDSEKCLKISVDSEGNPVCFFGQAQNRIIYLGHIIVDYPTPFEKGDIVSRPDGEEPAVLKFLPQWESGVDPDTGRQRIVTGTHAEVYLINEDGDLETTSWSIDGLQYYTGELEGQDRFLEYLSQYMKEGREDIDKLIQMFLGFKAESESELRKRFAGFKEEAVG